MTTAYWLTADVLKGLRAMPDDSADLVCTSPPFLALRKYLPADDPAGELEGGQQRTPADFVDWLLEVTAELGRVLTPHGSLVVELGDTQSGSGGSGGDYNPGGMREGQAAWQGSARREGGSYTIDRDRDRWAKSDKRPGWPLAKSAALVPEAYRLALAYGFNPLRGPDVDSPAGLWRVRNVVRWVRPNPPVGQLGFRNPSEDTGDARFRPATSDLVIACRRTSRYFDLDAVRTRPKHDDDRRFTYDDERQVEGAGYTPDNQRTNWRTSNGAGAPPRDYWLANDLIEGLNPEDAVEVLLDLLALDDEADAWPHPTGTYKGAHHATWPKGLLRRPILAMAPQRVCRHCGKPSERIVDHRRTFSDVDAGAGRSDDATAQQGGPFGRDYDVTSKTIGWTSCPHDESLWPEGFSPGELLAAARRAKRAKRTDDADRYAAQIADAYRGDLGGWHDGANWRPGRVLDPFAGSGTTLEVATGHGREAIGIDLDRRNLDLARGRLGMFLVELETFTDWLTPEPAIVDSKPL